MEIKKPILVSMGLLVGISILSGCSKNEIKSENNNSVNTLNQNENQNQVLDNNNQEKKISIGDGCIGCGRCVQIAPSNFAMGGRHASVISQENIDSQSVKTAIERCPVNVIKTS